jgi:hypothetical protein
MPSAEFKPTNPVSERLQTHAFDRAATGIGGTNFCSDQLTQVQDKTVTNNPYYSV